ncbi:SDR family oxidoreductase [Amycolatopsis pithecellobii]|uniref:SDR family oxidoreductase n=1 Tax=Amycolatopsis pithecellobii TaxID=664692 RepID=A0A6N7YU32_9PSEU|nr:SDR family NAD(P)-dependent oxidoreductase [Amycolatopsis pithecellobii]MTD55438.1 SDR family oxidoreductase [Amycolatopsis pithecellobii]
MTGSAGPLRGPSISMSFRYTGEFDGRTVLVTGGGSGIGAAVAGEFASAGACVAVADIDAEAAARISAELPGESTSHCVDVANSQQVFRLFKEICRLRDSVDVVVHCAGVDDPDTKTLIAAQQERGERADITAQLSDEQWQRMIDINLSGAFYVVRSSLQHMLPQGRGSIVVIGSQAGVTGVSAYPHYSASKGGVHALCRAVAAEVAGRGIRVNSIAPGEIDTPMLARTPPAMTGTLEVRIPALRRGRPEEVARVALFLASEMAGYVVGETVMVNGGLSTV